LQVNAHFINKVLDWPKIAQKLAGNNQKNNSINSAPDMCGVVDIAMTFF
jgi:hypothetical protein